MTMIDAWVKINNNLLWNDTVNYVFSYKKNNWLEENTYWLIVKATFPRSVAKINEFFHESCFEEGNKKINQFSHSSELQIITLWS